MPFYEFYIQASQVVIVEADSQDDANRVIEDGDFSNSDFEVDEFRVIDTYYDTPPDNMFIPVLYK